MHKGVIFTEKLVDDIVLYLDYLNTIGKFSASIHFSEKLLPNIPNDWFLKLSPYNTHSNPYCVNVKRNLNGTNKCISEQRNYYKKLSKDKSIFNICHAGVYEYITPFCNKNEVIGFVAVSGYRTSFLPDGINKTLWKKHLNSEDFPTALCNAVIPPLCVMLGNLFKDCNSSVQSEHNEIIQYLNEYHASTTLSDLCNYFNRSKSYISHMFKKTYGVTLSQYCNNLKLEDSKELLSNTDLSVTEVAFQVGFNDVSHFISTFNKKFGITPLQYRKNLK